MLLTVFFIVSVLEIFSLAFFARQTIFGQATERNQNKIIAFNAAEAAVDNAIAQLRSNSNYAGTTAFTALNAGSNQGGYEIQVCPPSCTGLTAPTDSNIRLLKAAGYAPGNVSTAQAYEVRPVMSYVQLSTTPFNHAAYARNSLTLNGTPLVDSYDSSVGNYSSSNRGSEGDIATGSNSITYIGHPTVNGSTQTGITLECSPATATVPSMGSLNLSSGTYNLTAGTYHFDSISITGNAKITASGPVVIYVDGEVNIAGNGVATSGNTPSNFLIYATSSSAVNISGNSAFYGAVYAPSSQVQYSGGGDFYGAVFSDTYTQSGNYSLHFDTQLNNVNAPCTQVQMKSWEETSTENS